MIEAEYGVCWMPKWDKDLIRDKVIYYKLNPINIVFFGANIIDFNNETRKCCHCNNWKNFNCFCEDNRQLLGFSGICKECHNEINEKYRNKDLEKTRSKAREYYHRNSFIYNIRTRNKYKNNIEEERRLSREYLRKHRAKKEVRTRHNEKQNKRSKRREVKDLRNKRNKERRLKDVNFKIMQSLRSRILRILKKEKIKKLDKTKNLLGCNLNFLKNHLLEKFKIKYGIELDWRDFSTSYKKYAIDHIIPFEAFNLSLLSAQKAVCHWSNLEILLYKDNDKKSDFLIDGTRARDLKVKYTGLESFLGVNTSDKIIYGQETI